MARTISCVESATKAEAKVLQSRRRKSWSKMQLLAVDETSLMEVCGGPKSLPPPQKKPLLWTTKQPSRIDPDLSPATKEAACEVLKEFL